MGRGRGRGSLGGHMPGLPWMGVPCFLGAPPQFCCFRPWQGDPGAQGVAGPPGEDGERVRPARTGGEAWTAEKTALPVKLPPP